MLPNRRFQLVNGHHATPVERQSEQAGPAIFALIRPNSGGMEADCLWAEEGVKMKVTLASLAVAVALLGMASSEASAWTCRAVGLSGYSYARHPNIIDAKLLALRRCERMSTFHVCTLAWCR
jgi:hypothetical protein